MEDFLNSPLYVPSQGSPKLNQYPHHYNAISNTKSSKINTILSNNWILSHNDHTSNIITTVDTNNKHSIIDRYTIQLQTTEPTKVQPPEVKSIIKSDHETILSKINTNNVIECNTSVNLLVDIEEGGTIIVMKSIQNNIQFTKRWSPSLHTQQIIYV